MAIKYKVIFDGDGPTAGRITGVVTVPEEFIPENDAGFYVDAPPGPGMAVVNGQLAAAPDALQTTFAPTLAQAKAQRLAALSAQCDAALGPLKAGYPDGEQQTWDKQEREARAHVADPQASTPLLTALAQARGVTLDDLAQRVIAKADAFAAYCGAVIGKRQRYEDAIFSATTIADVEAIVWTD